jgi:hypothetical protein
VLLLTQCPPGQFSPTVGVQTSVSFHRRGVLRRRPAVANRPEADAKKPQWASLILWWDGTKIGNDCSEVRLGHSVVVFKAHWRLELAPIAGEAFGDRAFDLSIGPRADACDGMRRNVGRDGACPPSRKSLYEAAVASGMSEARTIPPSSWAVIAARPAMSSNGDMTLLALEYMMTRLARRSPYEDFKIRRAREN